MIQYFSVCSPYGWVQVDRRGTVLDRGEADSLSAIPRSRWGVTLVAVVPGEEVVTRKVSVPSRNRRKVLAALPYALEEGLSADVDALHFALLDWRPGADATVAVVSRERLDAWLRELEEAGLKVQRMLPDYLLLPIHPQARYTVAKAGVDRICVRAEQMAGMAFDIDAMEFWWRELTDKTISIAVNDAELARQLIKLDGSAVSEWEIGDDFTSWVAHHRKSGPEINLLQGTYADSQRDQSTGGLKVAATMLALAAAIKVGADSAEYFSLKRQNEQLDAQIVQTFRTTFPDITRIVNPRVQMEREVIALTSGAAGRGEFQYLLATVARAVPPSQATLEEVAFRDNALLITISTGNFAGLDQLKKRFEQDKTVRSVLISSGSSENRVSGRFKLERAT
ncbi:MAG: type II secretion system protein GspL [Gammaproteobacteria bacterium]|nr:type II secretion system protein GspL [Gammaproteobacteria bacterium]